MATQFQVYSTVTGKIHSDHKTELEAKLRVADLNELGDVMEYSYRPISFLPMRFLPGQRVTATLYGERREGTVTKHTSSIVWVKWDGKDYSSWQHPESLTLMGA